MARLIARGACPSAAYPSRPPGKRFRRPTAASRTSLHRGRCGDGHRSTRSHPTIDVDAERYAIEQRLEPDVGGVDNASRNKTSRSTSSRQPLSSAATKSSPPKRRWPQHCKQRSFVQHLGGPRRQWLLMTFHPAPLDRHYGPKRIFG